MVSNEETPELTRQRIEPTASETLEQLFAENSETQTPYNMSFGYAVFDARQLTVVGATAGYGRGVATERVSNDKTYM